MAWDKFKDKLRTGDGTAFSHPLLLGLLKSLICEFRFNDDEAKDFIQMVLIRIYEKKASVIQARQIPSYVYRLARNIAVDMTRKRTSADDLRNRARIEESPGEAVDDEGSAGALLNTNLAEIIDVIRSLPAELLAAFCAWFPGILDGRDVTDKPSGTKAIAKILHVSTATVKRRKQKIRQHLEKHDRINPRLKALGIRNRP